MCCQQDIMGADRREVQERDVARKEKTTPLETSTCKRTLCTRWVNLRFLVMAFRAKKFCIRLAFSLDFHTIVFRVISLTVPGLKPVQGHRCRCRAN